MAIKLAKQAELASDSFREGGDARYAALQPGEVPLTECLKDTVARVLPYWEGELAPRIRQGQRLLVSAHGNSIRALLRDRKSVV